MKHLLDSREFLIDGEGHVENKGGQRFGERQQITAH
jgi:hypothetical protein